MASLVIHDTLPRSGLAYGYTKPDRGKLQLKRDAKGAKELALFSIRPDSRARANVITLLASFASNTS